MKTTLTTKIRIVMILAILINTTFSKRNNLDKIVTIPTLMVITVVATSLLFLERELKQRMKTIMRTSNQLRYVIFEWILIEHVVIIYMVFLKIRFIKLQVVDKISKLVEIITTSKKMVVTIKLVDLIKEIPLKRVTPTKHWEITIEIWYQMILLNNNNKAINKSINRNTWQITMLTILVAITIDHQAKIYTIMIPTPEIRIREETIMVNSNKTCLVNPITSTTSNLDIESINHQVNISYFY